MSNCKQTINALHNYTVGKTIGEGTFGKVKLAVHNLTGCKVFTISGCY